MTFKEWKIWFNKLPWSLRWFPILVIIRPVVDQFWNLKSISPLLSPLYWVGLLTPIFCFAGIRKYQAPVSTSIVKIFGFWTVLAVINSVLILIVYHNLEYLILILKITLPVYLFFFLRVFVLSKEDLIGILTSFIYSCGIVLLFFIYELIFGPRSIQITRGTLERYEGGFADVMNYAIYAVSGFVILCYFYFLRHKGSVFRRLLPAIIGLLLCLLILAHIYHTTSFIAIAALIALALFRIFKKNPSIGILFIIVVGVTYLTIGEEIIQNAFDPLVNSEIQIQEKGGNERREFNGRMGRWMDRWDEFNEGNLVGKIFGSGVGFFATRSIIGIAVHNDFFRIIFFTGFLGIFFYMIFYMQLFFRRKYLDDGDKFLLEATLIIIFLYSVTTLPTMYPPFMYFLFSVFAYVCLPPEQLDNSEAEEEFQ